MFSANVRWIARFAWGHVLTAFNSQAVHRAGKMEKFAWPERFSETGRLAVSYCFHHWNQKNVNLLSGRLTGVARKASILLRN